MVDVVAAYLWALGTSLWGAVGIVSGVIWLVEMAIRRDVPRLPRRRVGAVTFMVVTLANFLLWSEQHQRLHPAIRVFEEAPVNWVNENGVRYSDRTPRILLFADTPLAMRVGERQELNPCVMAPDATALASTHLFIWFETAVEMVDFVENPSRGWSHNNDGSYSERLGSINAGDCINGWSVLAFRPGQVGTVTIRYRVTTSNTVPVEDRFTVTAVKPSE